MSMFKSIYISEGDFIPDFELQKLNISEYTLFTPRLREFSLIPDMPQSCKAHQELDNDIQALEFAYNNFSDNIFLICKQKFQVLDNFSSSQLISIVEIDWDVLYLGGLNQVKAPLQIAKGIVRCKFALNNHLYFIKRDYIPILLKRLKRIEFQSDLAFAKTQELENAMWCSTIRNLAIPVNQENVISAIEPELFNKIRLSQSVSNNNTLVNQIIIDESKIIKQSLTSNPNFGINVFGFLNDTIGISRSNRNFLSLLNKLSNVGINLYDLKSKSDFKYVQCNFETSYKINLFFVNPDWMFDVPIETFKNKYNIGYWYWELEKLPRLWKKFSKYLDEIWVSTTYIKSILENELPGKKIRLIQKPFEEVEIIPKSVARQSFDFIDADDFVFLFVFDYHSDINRKNVINLIKIFNQFNQDKNCKLILKTQKSQERQRINDRNIVESFKSKSVIIINDVYSEDELTLLYNSCDVYISLHRSEGFGLTISESIFRDKPIIATAYSGNMDFCIEIDELLVKYKKCNVISNDIYERILEDTQCQWAEPDLEDALNKMTFVFENYQHCVDLVKNCKTQIKSKFDFNNCYNQLAQILNELKLLSKPNSV